MAHLFTFAEKDTTIFNRNELIYRNVGRDEILRIEKTYYSEDISAGLSGGTLASPSIARTLIQFNLDNVKEKIQNGTIVNPTFVLNLKTVEAKEIPVQYVIEASPVSQSWEMGTGRLCDGNTIDGASWKFRDTTNANGMLWYDRETTEITPVDHLFNGCWSGSYTGFWKGIATGNISGIFNGYYSSSVFGEGTYFSGSLNGTFNGYITGSFEGSVVLNIQSSSLLTSIVDNSPLDSSGGGTWYLSQTQSIRGGCLDVLENPSCSFSGNWTPNYYYSDDGTYHSEFSDETSSYFVMQPYWNSSEYFVGEESGDFNTGSICDGYYHSYQLFNYESSDISMNVTNIVNAWINDCIPNSGFLLKYANECGSQELGKLQFFSMDTNTIYVPTLDCQWDDSQFEPTASAEPLVDTNKVVYISNMRPEYKAGSVSRFNVFGRQKYPVRTFKRTSEYLTSQYLPETSYYAIQDADSEEFWIGFDDFTKISCDYQGNYFNLDTSGLPQERYFRVIIKIEQDGLVDYYTDPSIFKISR
jgi:hypothetical protein